MQIVRPGGRFDQAAAIKADPLNAEQFAAARVAFGAISHEETKARTRGKLQVAAAAFEKETRFWFRTAMEFPMLLFIYALPGFVGRYFVYKMLCAVEPEWVQGVQFDVPAACRADGNRIDQLFTAAYHVAVRAGLGEYNPSLAEAYDWMGDLNFAWHTVWKLGRFKDQWLKWMRGSVNAVMGKLGHGIDDLCNFAYNFIFNKNITNLGIEQHFSAHNWVGDVQLGDLRQEWLVQGVMQLLKRWREVLKHPDMREKDGALKAAGKAP